jgi:hypothetical protein
MSTLPNDRRTRQLYIDAAIKRAQSKAREARLLASADSDEGGATMTATAPRVAAAVPLPREGRH